MTQKITSVANKPATALAAKPPHLADEVLGELYAVKLQLNREANYEVSVLLTEARAEAKLTQH